VKEMPDGEFIWRPTREILDDSNLARFIRYIGCKDFEDLYNRSIDDLECFWNSVSCYLKIRWDEPYSKVMDESRGIQWTKWFQNGKINIAKNCLDIQSNTIPEKVALISEKESGENVSLTYYELLKLTNRIANALVFELKIRKGDKVGLFMPMIPEAIAAFLAVIKIGAVVVPLFSGYGPEAVSTRLSDCDAVSLITSESFERRGKSISMVDVVFQSLKDVKSLRSILVFGSSPLRNPESIATSHIQLFDWKIVENSKDVLQAEKTDSEDPFMIVYTSGTTGKPKGAVHVHGGFLVKVAEEVSFQMDLRFDDILFWVTDMGWIMAPWEIIGALSLGSTIFIYDGAPDYPRSDRLWEIIEKYRVTKFGISPTLVRALMKYGIEPVLKHDLSSIRAFGSTGEPWNPESYRWLFEKVGKKICPIVNISGGTEVGVVFISVHTLLPMKATSVGHPSLGIDAKVLDENGNSITEKTGELAVVKPWPGMTRGLWKAKERYIETYWSRFPNIWVHGDWASIDQDGYWFLHGRSDDTIKVAGKRLGPTEVESILASHPSVLESVAIGVPDELKGEAVVSFVVLRPDVRESEDLADELAKYVGKSLGNPMKPKKIIFVSSIPKTRNAKLVRRLVKAKYLNLPLGDVSNLENPESLKVIPSSK
jgi:acetyl-CoA synthetase